MCGCGDVSLAVCLAYKGMGSCDMLGSSDDILKKIFVQLLCPKTCGACTVNERCRAPGGQGCAWTVTTVFKGAVSHNGAPFAFCLFPFAFCFDTLLVRHATSTVRMTLS